MRRVLFSEFRYKRELDGIIAELKINLANNYKEPAHKARERLAERTGQLYAQGRISDKTREKYMRIYEEYSLMMKDYHH